MHSKIIVYPLVKLTKRAYIMNNALFRASFVPSRNNEIRMIIKEATYIQEGKENDQDKKKKKGRKNFVEEASIFFFCVM